VGPSNPWLFWWPELGLCGDGSWFGAYTGGESAEKLVLNSVFALVSIRVSYLSRPPRMGMNASGGRMA
jgi:hypothetical protein